MGTGKKKIEIKKKEKESDRMVTFSKRKQGLFKKASQLNALTGSEVAILVFSPAGRPHTNAPFFHAALSRYFHALGARGGATTAADDGDASGSKDDSSIGMWLDSVGDLRLGVESGSNAEPADGSGRGSENDGSVGMWLNSVESLLGGEGGASTGDCSASENCRCIREWLNSVEVEGVEKVEDLLVLKQRLENIKEKVMKKVDDAICCSYFV